MQTNLKAKALEALSRNEDEAALKEVGDKIMRACTADKKWSFHWQNRICSFVRFETRGELGKASRGNWNSQQQRMLEGGDDPV